MEKWTNQLSAGLPTSKIVEARSDWQRFSSYQLTQNIAGEESIAPEQEAELINYKPFDCYPKILVDFLNLCFATEEEYFNKAALSFISNYGFLGLRKKAIDDTFNNEIHNINVIYLYTGEIIFHEITGVLDSFGEDVTDPRIYEALYYYKEALKPFCFKYPANELVLTGESFPLDLDARPYYFCEPVNLIKQESKEFYHKIKWVLYFLESGSNIDDYVKDPYVKDPMPNCVCATWGSHIEMATCIENIELSLIYNAGHFEIDYKFYNLVDALKLMFLQAFTTHNQPVKQCVHCRSWFIKRDKKQAACSSSCREANRQARLQKRKREARRLFREGKTTEEVAAVVGGRKTTIENWFKEFAGKN